VSKLDWQMAVIMTLLIVVWAYIALAFFVPLGLASASRNWVICAEQLKKDGWIAK
jgi:hypothetical protein